MELPSLGIQSELQLLACTTATAMSNPSHIFDLHHSSRQCRILNPLSEAKDQTHNLMFLVGFVSAVPRWEHPKSYFKSWSASAQELPLTARYL